MSQGMRTATVLGIVVALIAQASLASAEGRRRRGPRSEVVAWTAEGSLVVFAEPRRGSRRAVDLVARAVPTGEVVARRQAHPGPCARVIDGQVAVAHACGLAKLRPDLPRRFSGSRFHVAASERARVQRISLRSGSLVEREIPSLGLVLRGRTEEAPREGPVAVLEVSRVGREGSRVVDRRPIGPRARRHWILLQAGDDGLIIVGPGVLRSLRRPEPRSGQGDPPRSDLARARPRSG